jgi:hypothetical protein
MEGLPSTDNGRENQPSKPAQARVRRMQAENNVVLYTNIYTNVHKNHFLHQNPTALKA